ncbi:MAG: AAA family ATPase [Patescibacteria group bacterium]
MYLKSLEITGFKSFAKKVDLDFKTNVTAIVGPNGSGKSNVAEAFRFVLGEQSIKSMRGKRGEDLIFNGSQTIPRGNRAGVKITFDNSSRFLDLDFDEVSIERNVFRDGTNTYLINKSPVRLKDISELLSGANIGSSGHHMISQGEADRILNVNAKERKGIIEEALGLKIFQYKRMASEKKLEKVHENIKEVQALRKENAPHLKFLKRQIGKIEKTQEMRIELQGLYKEYFKRENTYIKYWQDKILQDKKPLLEELNQLETKEKEISVILENETKDESKNGQLRDFENQLNICRRKKDELSRELGRTEGIISALEISTEKPEKIETQDSSEKKMVDLVEIKKLQEEINNQIELAENMQDISQFKGLLKRISESFSSFVLKYSQIENIEAKAEIESAVDNRIFEYEDKKIQIENELKEIFVQEEGFLKEISALKTEIENEKDLNKDARFESLEISNKINDIRYRLNSLQNQEERIVSAEENYKKEMNEAYVLVGRDAVQFKDLDLLSPSGEKILIETIVNEAREIQGDRLKKIERIKILIESMGGGSGEDVLKEYDEVSKRDEFLEKEIMDLEKSAESLNQLIAELKEKLDTEFKKGLEKINEQFKEFFILMFGGGRSGLNLVKEKGKRTVKDDLNMSEEDLVEEIERGESEKDEFGIEVDISLPNKKVKGLQMLSGGERSLTSIALLFAMSQVNPPPFVILDETDAALDEANSRKYGDMIEKLSSHSQLILITHNRETMSRAGILYGVTMTGDGISKLLSVQFAEAVKVAK